MKSIPFEALLACAVRTFTSSHERRAVYLHPRATAPHDACGRKTRRFEILNNRFFSLGPERRRVVVHCGTQA